MAISHKNGLALTGLSAVNGVTSISALNGVSATLGGGSAPPAFGAEVTRTSTSSSSSTMAVTIPSTVAVGRRLVIVVNTIKDQAISGITDNRSNTWVKDLDPILLWDVNTWDGQIWSTNVTTDLVNTDTVTVTFGSPSFSARAAAVFVLDGIAASSHVDQDVMANNGFSSTPNITASTTATETALIGLIATRDNVTYGSSAWSVIGAAHDVGGKRFYYVYKNASSAGSQNPNGSFNGSAQCGGAWVAYKA